MGAGETRTTLVICQNMFHNKHVHNKNLAVLAAINYVGLNMLNSDKQDLI